MISLKISIRVLHTFDYHHCFSDMTLEFESHTDIQKCCVLYCGHGMKERELGRYICCPLCNML